MGPAGKLLRQAGVDLGEVGVAKDRRLMFELPGGGKALLVKPSDVPTYVEHGVADVGIAGSDTLHEQARDLYEPVDLQIGVCRLSVAEPRDRPARLRRGMRLRVATKYTNLARRHYREKGIDPELIPLYGSVELGAITGLADQIVDVVESGETLRQNHLVEVETIVPVSSRLIVHPASLKLKPERIAALIDALRHVVGAAANGPGKVAAAR